MKKRNTGIPTVYKGIQFRSRLEARWATFFDLCGWHWKYEPFDMAGWIPDFLISPYSEGFTKPGVGFYHGQDPADQFLVEVRPADFQGGVEEKVTKAQSGRPWRNVLILSDGPQKGDRWFSLAGKMVLQSSTDTNYYRRIYLAVIHSSGVFDPPLPPCAVESGRPTLFAPGYSGECLMLSQETNISFMEQDGMETIAALWNQAGNKVQWKGAQNHE